MLVEYDVRVKAPVFSWQSHPLPFTISQSHSSELREVVLCAVGEGTVEVNVSTAQNPGGQTQTFEFESNNADGPDRRYASRVGKPFAVTGTHHQVRVVSRSLDGKSAAPHICPPLSLGFKPSAHIPTAR